MKMRFVFAVIVGIMIAGCGDNGDANNFTVSGKICNSNNILLRKEWSIFFFKIFCIFGTHLE